MGADERDHLRRAIREALAWIDGAAGGPPRPEVAARILRAALARDGA